MVNPLTSPACPRRVALLGDFSGRGARQESRDTATLCEQQGRTARLGELDRLLASWAPALNVQGLQHPLTLTFRCLDDFHPDALLRTEALALACAGMDPADALRTLLRQPAFQALERVWRGVDDLLHRLEPQTAPTLVLFDLSDDELRRELNTFEPNHGARNALRHWLVEQPSTDAAGPFSHITLYTQFAATATEVQRLSQAARWAASADAILVVGIDSTDFEPGQPDSLPDAMAALRELQASPAAAHLLLLSPRVLVRAPYSAWSEPIESFAFEEAGDAPPASALLWGSPVLLALATLASSTKANTQAPPLTVVGLPVHYARDLDGQRVAQPCTERLMDAGLATRLGALGVRALMARRGEAVVRFAGLSAVNGGAVPPLGSSAASPLPGLDVEAGLQSTLRVTTASSSAESGTAHYPSGETGTSAATDDGFASTSEAWQLPHTEPSWSDFAHSDPDISTDTDTDTHAAVTSPDTASDSHAPENTPFASPDLDPELAALLKSLQ